MSQDEVSPNRAADSSSAAFPPLIDRVIVLTGPTAVGKSCVAMELARRIGGEIVSLDSIAVYVGMDIGTAKPTAAQRRLVPHHLIDLVPPTEDYSVARYLRAAHDLVEVLADRGRVPIFVGGTPLFLKGVLRGFDPGPPADWEFRRSVEEDIERHGLESLRERLRQVDPLAAHRIGASDKRRMIRALEFVRQTGIPISHRQTQFDRALPAEECLAFALRQERGQLHERINRRVEEMFDQGLVDEVRGLIDRHGALSRTARQAVGYREVLDWLTSGGDLAARRDSVAAHTRQLARRQETWFRSFQELRFVDVDLAPDPSRVDLAPDPSRIASEIAEQVCRSRWQSRFGCLSSGTSNC